MYRRSLRPIEIMLVEDSTSDADLVVEALRDVGLNHKLTIATAADAAISILGDESRRKPDLIVLDLNLGDQFRNGFDVLRYIKASPSLSFIPVIMFTTSSRDEDVLSSYNNRANCFVTKPQDFEAFLVTVKSICDFWCATATLPSDNARA